MILDQQIKDAGQMRTPPPLTPHDIESRVLRICNEYDKIQEANKNKVNTAIDRFEHYIETYHEKSLLLIKEARR